MIRDRRSRYREGGFNILRSFLSEGRTKAVHQTNMMNTWFLNGRRRHYAVTSCCGHPRNISEWAKETENRFGAESLLWQWFCGTFTITGLFVDGYTTRSVLSPQL